MRLSPLQKIILLTGVDNRGNPESYNWRVRPHKAARQYYGETRTYPIPRPFWDKKGKLEWAPIDHTEKVYGGWQGHETTDRAIRAALSRSLRILRREWLINSSNQLTAEGVKVARRLLREEKTGRDVNSKKGKER